MAKKCDLCGRKSKKSVSRSHSNIATIRRQLVNLQVRTIGGKKTKVCTKCLKTQTKSK